MQRLSAGPDVGQARNASLKASGGACGSERSACWAKSGNGQSATTVNSINKSNGNNATLRSAAPAHIELQSIRGVVGSEGFGQVYHNNGLNKKNNINNQELVITSTYPPSPPSDAATLGSDAAGPAKPLTMANVSTFSNAAAAAPAVVGGSPFSAISTSPTDVEDAESSEGDSGSEISFSSDSSVSSSNAAANTDHRFLASVFGPTYLDSFTKLGVHVTLPTQDVFPAELGLKGSAVLSAPEHGTKTAYLCPKEMEKLDSETLVELLEIADEDLECSALVICLERKGTGNIQDDNERIAETLHALMYVGGSIVSPDAGVVKYDSEKYILVGLDL